MKITYSLKEVEAILIAHTNELLHSYERFNSVAFSIWKSDPDYATVEFIEPVQQEIE